jgi:hypothetical protein
MPGVDSSPEMDFFRRPERPRQASRWKEDWEELELLVRLSIYDFLLPSDVEIC